MHFHKWLWQSWLQIRKPKTNQTTLITSCCCG